MLDPTERAAVATRFGVPDVQVLRDHLIAHLLAVLAQRLGDRVIFFGGTALALTHLPGGRLSEDIDLFAVPSRAAVVADLERDLVTGVRREYGGLAWEPAPTAIDGATPAILRSPGGLVVRVQLLDPVGYPSWPTERRQLVRRYSDVPITSLDVLTRSAFAASKTAAWHDRRAPRDLYDLWGLAQVGALDSDAAHLFARFGPTGHAPSGWMFDRPPNENDWEVQLAGQTKIAVPPDEALMAVREAWATATGTQ